MSRYETAIDLANLNNSQTQLIALVGAAKTVLDVGCAAGDMARVLTARGCRVSGVDIDAEAASPARQILDELVIADIEQTPLSTYFKPKTFDSVVFGDVLEHLADPWSALRDAIGLLRDDGRILVSIPNVSHGALRLALLSGQWNYTDTGLLDRTHLRFFTLEGVYELLESAGLVIEVLRSTVLDPLAVPEVDVDDALLPGALVEWVRHQPRALDYQFIAVARVLAPGEARGQRPVLEPALPYDVARLRDGNSQKLRNEQDLRHRLLTLRDHVIGLEAKAVAAQSRTHRVKMRAKRAERRARNARLELQSIITELEGISRSKRPRTHLRRLVGRLRAAHGLRPRDAEHGSDA